MAITTVTTETSETERHHHKLANAGVATEKRVGTSRVPVTVSLLSPAGGGE